MKGCLWVLFAIAFLIYVFTCNRELSMAGIKERAPYIAAALAGIWLLGKIGGKRG